MTTWTVPATVLRVVDGDTLEVLLDLGWHITLKSKLRLAGVNCPELEKPLVTPPGPGRLAQMFTDNSLFDIYGISPDGDSPGAYFPITVVSHSLDKYGRVLGSVHWTDRKKVLHDLSTDLLAAGHAVPM
jgi:hypothetical protein